MLMSTIEVISGHGRAKERHDDCRRFKTSTIMAGDLSLVTTTRLIVLGSTR